MTAAWGSRGQPTLLLVSLTNMSPLRRGDFGSDDAASSCAPRLCGRPTARCTDLYPLRREGLAVAVTRAVITRGDVHLVRLDPALGSEIRKTRRCLVVSPDELNQHLRSVIVAPMTTSDTCTRGGWPAAFRTDRGLWRWINSGQSIASAWSNDWAACHRARRRTVLRRCRKCSPGR